LPVVTSSTTVRCKLSRPAHTLMLRTSHRLLENPAFE
jgi:hypothetical protein